MNMYYHICRYFFLFSLLLPCSVAWSYDISGYLGLESKYYTADSAFQSSLSFEPEVYWKSSAGNDSLVASVFTRWDDKDDERTHSDLRELMWIHTADNWELHSGVGKVFWGVTESVHLVDVINQTDVLESFDGEAKLGQPMIHLIGIFDWGVLDGFVLPMFRERAFSAHLSRGNNSVPIVTDFTVYESGAEDKHVDLAVRYSHTFGDWDIGLAYFAGTNREPYFIASQDNGYLKPYYTQMSQVSLDIQAALGSLLWKLEAISRHDTMEAFSAISAGLEYTLVGVFGGNMDLGLLSEWHKDSGRKFAPSATQNDIFVGTRLAFNDIQDTSILMGLSQDLDDASSYIGVIEAGRRLGDSWRLSVDGLLVHSDNPQDPVYRIKNTDQLTINIEYYF